MTYYDIDLAPYPEVKDALTTATFSCVTS